MMNPEIELLTSTSTGAIATRLLASNFNVSALRTQDVLRKDEWVQYDAAVVDVARHRLVGIGDLISRGLTYGLPNALGHTKVEWERQSDMGGAEVSMSGLSEGRNDRLDFNLTSVPIPIVHKDFSLNIRALAASRNGGAPLDMTQAEIATRKVAEMNESILYNGYTALGTNNVLYGYKTAPNRVTGSVTASWLTATGEQIVGDVLAMINALQTKNMYGPYQLSVPLAVSVKLDNDYKAGSDKTIRQRIMEIAEIGSIVKSYYLTASNILMVQLTRDVVDVIDGMQPTLLQWDSHGGMQTNFKVMSILVPRMKDTYSNQSGICHYS